MKYKIILLVIASLYITGCGNTPIFTEMKTNRLKIVLKGTLESEPEFGGTSFVAPSTYSTNNAAAAVSMEDSATANDSVNEVKAPAEDLSPTTFMIDIAEIRLNGKKISNYRQVLSIPIPSPGTGPGTDASAHPFFNGTGIELTTDDPGAGNYDSVQLYIRKMVFDNAKVYQLVGNTFSYEKDYQVIFHEKTISGFDFNQFMVNSYWDSLRLESSETIRIFPVQIPIIGGMKYTKENGETVLEIRLVVKNFIKKYEHGYYDGGVYKVLHYYALSDWLRDVHKGESDIGRNLHAVARAYVKEKTGSITVNSAAGLVVAIPSTETLAEYGPTTTGKLLRTAVGNSDIPLPPSYPGTYIEPILDYYLKYEKYKSDWKAMVTDTGLTLTQYSTAWDTYETNVKGSIDGSNPFDLKIPPYVAYSSGSSVTFRNMAPGTYKFYRRNTPSYGTLILSSEFSPLNGGADVIISEGTNTGF